MSLGLDALFNTLGHHDSRNNFGVGAVPRFTKQLYDSSRASVQYLDLWGPAVATNNHKSVTRIRQQFPHLDHGIKVMEI